MMYLKWYKLGMSHEKCGKFHINYRYIRFLKKLGMDVEVKLEDGVIEEETDKEKGIIVSKLD
jgi:hypothetical protein